MIKDTQSTRSFHTSVWRSMSVMGEYTTFLKDYVEAERFIHDRPSFQKQVYSVYADKSGLSKNTQNSSASIVSNGEEVSLL